MWHKLTNTDMTRHFITRASMVILLSCFCCALSIAQYDYDLDQLRLKLDLHKLTLNKLPINELTPEKVTDLLGEPTFDDNSWMRDITGPKVWYNYEGLFFWFRPKSKDPEQKLYSLTVYTVNGWDELNEEVILVFPGEINPALTGDYKVDDITNMFKKYPITFQSAADYRLERSQSSGDTAHYNHDLVWVENKNGWVCFSCDEVTKFLDYITISFR